MPIELGIKTDLKSACQPICDHLFEMGVRKAAGILEGRETIRCVSWALSVSLARV
jgi:hypothetical protein